MAGILIAACAEQPAVRLSVRGSALLGEYANPPLWVWTVDHGAAVAAVEASLDGGPFRYLHPAARSFRPARPLAPGRHTLTIRVTTAGAFAAQAEASAAASVAALPGAPPVPDDPCFPSEPVRCVRRPLGLPASGRPGRYGCRRCGRLLAAGDLRAPRSVVVAVLDTGYRPAPGPARPAWTRRPATTSFATEAAADGDGIDPDATDPATGGPWHGTAMAGVIAAQTDNGMGLAGMGWPWGRSRVAIMPVRVVAPRGATSYDVAQGLLYAAGLAERLRPRPAPAGGHHQSQLWRTSLPGPPDELLEDVLRRVTEAGAIVVSAAGNHGSAVRAPANSRYTVAVAGSGDATGRSRPRPTPAPRPTSSHPAATAGRGCRRWARAPPARCRGRSRSGPWDVDRGTHT